MDWVTIILEMAFNALVKWWTSSLHGPNQHVFGHRRSIVRLIGTLLPLAKAKRVQLDLALWQYDNEFELVSNGANSVSTVSDFIDEGHGSLSTDTANLPANSDIKKLLEEISELKTKMNEILLRQDVNMCCRKSSCCSIGAIHNQPTERSAVPPPPPPPLPPSLPLPTHSTPRKIQKQKLPSNGNTLKSAGLSAVLDELKSSRVTLKHVLRSPGGRPLKEGSSGSGTPVSDSGGDMLAEILRRRLSQTQYSDSDCSISSVHSDFFASPDRHFHY